jgi:hypothetical protein
MKLLKQGRYTDCLRIPLNVESPKALFGKPSASSVPPVKITAVQFRPFSPPVAPFAPSRSFFVDSARRVNVAGSHEIDNGL